MSPPEVGVDTAEIYVEGKLKMVDSFIRWCKRGDVGLSQVVSVSEVIDEEPTGMYEEFFCKTK
jgi:acylphosphatase